MFRICGLINMLRFVAKKEGKKLIKEDYDVSNIYKLDGRVPVSKAIPFGLQHVLAMFVSNVTPIFLISGGAQYNGNSFSSLDTALLVQAAMLIAGIGT